jgi:hypothetical protein
MASYPVKNFSNLSSGALPLNGVAQSLRAILRANLVTGWGTMAVTSLTVASGVATAQFAAAHPYLVGLVARVGGAGLAAANGEQLLTSITTNSASFAVPGAPDGPVAGSSITMEVAPAGWTEPFNQGGVSVFKPSAVEATGIFLRVDDSGTTNARVRAYETMTDAATGSGLIPLDAQVSGGLFWPKSGAASAAARPYFMVADARGFYFASAPQGGDRFTLMAAGDIASLKSGDAWGYCLTGNQSDQTAATTVPDGCCGWSHRSARGGAYLARLHTGVGQAVAAQRIGTHHNGTTADTYAGVAGYSLGAYPNGPNNSLITGSLALFASGQRGSLAGLLHPVQDCGGNFASGAVVAGTDDYAGHRLLAIRVAPPSGAVTPGLVFLDLSDWGR